MKTFTVVVATAIIIAVGGSGPIPFLVLCSVKSEAYGSRFAAAGLLAQATLVAEYVRLNGILMKGRKSSVNKEGKV